MYSLKHFNFTKPIRRSNVDFETAAISPLDKTTSCPRSSIFSRYCFDSPAGNFRIFLRSSSFDLPFRKDVFSFQRREIGVLNIQASSARRHFLFIVVRVKAVLLFSTRWKDNFRDYFDLVDVVASCSLCTLQIIAAFC